MPVEKRYNNALNEQVVEAAETELDAALELALRPLDLLGNHSCATYEAPCEKQVG